MRQVSMAALACTAVLAAGAARAQTYTVDKVTITGSRTVPTSELLAAIQEHKGSRVTKSDIIADQETITKVLGKANVVGGIKTSMVSKPANHIEVVFALEDRGAQAPVVTKVAPRLHSEVFTGNASVSSDTLSAAAGLKPGQELTNEAIQAAQKAVVAAYASAKLPVSVNVSADINQMPDGKVDLTWKVAETKAKKKRRNTEDEGQRMGQ